MEFGFKKSSLIAMIGSILVIFVVYFRTSIDSGYHSFSFLLTKTSQDAIEAEAELPPIARKQAL
jgi:hypothetical protein